MAHQYCTLELVKSLASPETDIADADTITQVNAMIDAVSAWIDTYTDRPANYFGVAADDPTVRRYRGQDKDLLRIGPHVGTAAVTIPLVAASLIHEDSNGWIRYDGLDNISGDEDYISTYKTGRFFEKDVTYHVSARWGFVAIPPDIVLACALIVGEIMDRGKGVIGQVSPAGFVIERAMPLAARDILDGRKRKEFEIN